MKNQFDYKKIEAEFDERFHPSISRVGVEEDNLTVEQVRKVKAFMRQTVKLYIASLKEKARASLVEESCFSHYPNKKTLCDACNRREGKNRTISDFLAMLTADEEGIK